MTLHVSELVVRGRRTCSSEYLDSVAFQRFASLLALGHGWPGASSEHLKQPSVVVAMV